MRNEDDTLSFLCEYFIRIIVEWMKQVGKFHLSVFNDFTIRYFFSDFLQHLQTKKTELEIFLKIISSKVLSLACTANLYGQQHNQHSYQVNCTEFSFTCNENIIIEFGYFPKLTREETWIF